MFLLLMFVLSACANYEENFIFGSYRLVEGPADCKVGQVRMIKAENRCILVIAEWYHFDLTSEDSLSYDEEDKVCLHDIKVIKDSTSFKEIRLTRCPDEEDMLFTNFLDYSKKGKLVYKGSLKEGSQMVIEEETCEWEAVEK